MIFEALWQERNLSKAGSRVGLSQPAMSHALNKLRLEFGDELFVRGGGGIIPTLKAESLAPRIKGLLERCQELYSTEAEGFLPEHATGVVRVNGTDYFDHLTLPWLIPHLQDIAPGVKLVTTAIKGRSPREDLEKGHCDLAIAGFFTQLPQEFFRQKLFDEDFVCVARRGHGKLKKGLSLDLYLELRHILISPQGDLGGVVEKALEPLGRKRTMEQT